MTINVGFWVIPLIVTIVSFVTSSFRVRQVTRDTRGQSWGNGLVSIAFHGLALIASLIAWLIWAVLT